MRFTLRPIAAIALAGALLLGLLVYQRASVAIGYDIVVSSVKSSAAVSGISLPMAKPLMEPEDDYLAICLAVKDQRRDLPEFLHHHYYNMGVGRFYVMDDGSMPPLSDMSDEELTIPRSAVEFHYFEAEGRENFMQFKLYNICAELARNFTNTTWIAFIDTDEFLDAPGPQSLREILKDFERIKVIGAVGVNWRVHSSGGHLTRQPSVIQAYTECIHDDVEHNGTGTNNRHVKSIVRVASYEQPHDPHSFILKDGAVTVGEYGDRVNFAFRMPITRDRLALHHYAVKSREEYEEKMNRGSAMSRHKGWEWWDLVETQQPHVPCTEMLRWAK